MLQQILLHLTQVNVILEQKDVTLKNALFRSLCKGMQAAAYLMLGNSKTSVLFATEASNLIKEIIITKQDNYLLYPMIHIIDWPLRVFYATQHLEMSLFHRDILENVSNKNELSFPVKNFIARLRNQCEEIKSMRTGYSNNNQEASQNPQHQHQYHHHQQSQSQSQSHPLQHQQNGIYNVSKPVLPPVIYPAQILANLNKMSQ